MIVALGLPAGQRALDRAFDIVGFETHAWQEGKGFETLLKATAPVFWLFFLLTSLAVFILRFRDPATPRPFWHES